MLFDLITRFISMITLGIQVLSLMYSCLNILVQNFVVSFFVVVFRFVSPNSTDVHTTLSSCTIPVVRLLPTTDDIFTSRVLVSSQGTTDGTSPM